MSKIGKGLHIAITILLVLAGLAIAVFFAWLGYKIFTWMGIGL